MSNLLHDEPITASVGTVTLTFLCDSSALSQAVLSLSNLADRFPKAVQAFLSRVDSASELVRLDCDDLAAGAGNVRVFLQPSDFLVHFLSAFRAGDCDGK